MKSCKHTPQSIKAADFALSKSGKSTREIADSANTSQSTVLRVLRSFSFAETFVKLENRCKKHKINERIGRKIIWEINQNRLITSTEITATLKKKKTKC